MEKKSAILRQCVNVPLAYHDNLVKLWFQKINIVKQHQEEFIPSWSSTGFKKIREWLICVSHTHNIIICSLLMLEDLCHYIAYLKLLQTQILMGIHQHCEHGEWTHHFCYMYQTQKETEKYQSVNKIVFQSQNRKKKKKIQIKETSTWTSTY